MRILVVSDIHIGGKFNEEMFNKGVEYLNNNDADYYIFTGDLTDQGTKAEFDLVRDIYLPKIKKPLLMVPGNHDVKNVGDLLWEEYIGPRYFVQTDEEKKVRILGLDSNEPDQNTGRMGSKAIERIYQEFKDLNDEWLKVLVFHHQTLPIKYTGRERSALIDAGDAIKAIMDCNIDLVLNGHRHISNVYKLTDGDVDSLIINCGTLSCKKTRYKEEYSLTSIELSDDYVEASVDILLLNEREPKWVNKFKGAIKEAILPEDPGTLLGTIVQIGNTEFSEGSILNQENLMKSIQLINSFEADVVIHTGDITSNSYKNQFKIAKDTLNLINHPLLTVPGPKDYYPLGFELYQEYFGAPETTFQTSNFHILGVNSCIIDEKIGRLGRSTCVQLLAELKKHNKLGIIAFHHNIIPLPRTKHESELQDAGDVLALIVENNVDLVLTGAKNTSGAWRIDNTIFVNAGTISSKNIISKKGNSFNVIQVYQSDKGKLYKVVEYFLDSNTTETIGTFLV